MSCLKHMLLIDVLHASRSLILKYYSRGLVIGVSAYKNMLACLKACAGKVSFHHAPVVAALPLFMLWMIATSGSLAKGISISIEGQQMKFWHMAYS